MVWRLVAEWFFKSVWVMGRIPVRGRVVLVSGFFDPPHKGHIAYLREAKNLGHARASLTISKGYILVTRDYDLWLNMTG